MKIGGIGIIVLIVGFIAVSVFVSKQEDENRARQRAQVAAFESTLTKLPKPPADAMTAINKRAQFQSRLFQKAGRTYTSNLYDIGVKSSGNGTMTVIGIENCTNSQNAATAGWRNVSFTLVKPSPEAAWQVTTMSSSADFPNKYELMFADANYPKSISVETTPLPDTARY
jgi:hypothetical protein